MSNEDTDVELPFEKQVEIELERMNRTVKNAASVLESSRVATNSVDFTPPEMQKVNIEQGTSNSTTVHVSEETDEVNVSLSELISSIKYRDNIRARVESAVRGIDANVEKMAKDVVSEHIESIVMHALGFRMGWGTSKNKWEIDTGRSSAISNRLSMLAQQRAEAMVDIFVENDRHLFLSTKLNDRLKKQMNETLNNQIDYKVMSIVRSRIDEIATERANHIIAMAFNEPKKG